MSLSGFWVLASFLSSEQDLKGRLIETVASSRCLMWSTSRASCLLLSQVLCEKLLCFIVKSVNKAYPALICLLSSYACSFFSCYLPGDAVWITIHCPLPSCADGGVRCCSISFRRAGLHVGTDCLYFWSPELTSCDWR